jgi:HEAT repeat protein
MSGAFIWSVIAVLLACLAAAMLAYSEWVANSPDGGAVFMGRPVQAWLDDLRAHDLSTNREALAAFGAMGPANEDAVPELIQALEDENPRVRAGAARGLGRIGPAARQALPALEAARENTHGKDLKEMRQARARIEGPYQDQPAPPAEMLNP